ncbi:MAG: hypothetical protein HOQ32_03730 [Lysobacter sp.]|nr:hypothetical protein [Lysobacter sp.]
MFWRSLIKLIAVAAFFAFCFAMLARVIGYASPWLGLLAMFYFMGLAKVAEPLFVLRMPRALHAVDPALSARPWYRRLGVRGFGDLLRNTPLRYLNGSVYRSAGRRSLEAVRRQAESAEATHFWAAVLFTPYIAYVAWRGFWMETLVFLAVQIAFNVYPILHLRAVRARLARLGFGAAE